MTETSACVVRVFSVAVDDRGYFVESSNKILINSGFSSYISLKNKQHKAGLLRNRLYFCRCVIAEAYHLGDKLLVIAIDPKVLYRFEVRVCAEIFAKHGFDGLGPFGVIRNFC